MWWWTLDRLGLYLELTHMIVLDLSTLSLLHYCCIDHKSYTTSHKLGIQLYYNIEKEITAKTSETRYSFSDTTR